MLLQDFCKCYLIQDLVMPQGYQLRIQSYKLLECFAWFPAFDTRSQMLLVQLLQKPFHLCFRLLHRPCTPIRLGFSAKDLGVHVKTKDCSPCIHIRRVGWRCLSVTMLSNGQRQNLLIYIPVWTFDVQVHWDHTRTYVKLYLVVLRLVVIQS